MSTPLPSQPTALSPRLWRLTVLVAILGLIGCGAASVYFSNKAGFWQSLVEANYKGMTETQKECSEGLTYRCDLAASYRKGFDDAVQYRDGNSDRGSAFLVAAIAIPLLAFAAYFGGKWVMIGRPIFGGRREIAPIVARELPEIDSAVQPSASNSSLADNPKRKTLGTLRGIGLIVGTGILAFLIYGALLILGTMTVHHFKSKGVLEAELFAGSFVRPLALLWIAAWLLLFGHLSKRPTPRKWGTWIAYMYLALWLVPYALSFLQSP